MAKATNISNFSIENLLAIPYKRRQSKIETSLNGRTSISSPQSNASSMTAEILSSNCDELFLEQKRTNDASQSNFRPICLEAERNPSQINKKEELHQQSCGLCQDCCYNALNDRSEFPTRISQCQNSRVTRDSIRLPYPEILSATTSLHKPHQVSYEDICKHCLYCWEGWNSTCEVNLKRGRENCDREVRAVHDPVNVRRAGENCDRELRAVHDPFGGSYHAEKYNDDARDTFRNGFCDIKDCNGWGQVEITSDNHTHNVEEKFDWMTNPRPFYKKENKRSPTFPEPKRDRTTFSKDQRSELERQFQLSHYPSRYHRSKMADYLNLTEFQIKVWFQNKRMWFKRWNSARMHANKFIPSCYCAHV